MAYNTKQKNLILNTIKNEKHEFTIKDIHSKIGDKTGLTTIYRLVDKLVDDGILNKSIGKDNVTYYQYFEKCNHDNHFYLKCEHCGKMLHVDCECIEDLSNHIKKEHGFNASKERIIINGVCKQCIKK